MCLTFGSWIFQLSLRSPVVGEAFSSTPVGGFLSELEHRQHWPRRHASAQLGPGDDTRYFTLPPDQENKSATETLIGSAALLQIYLYDRVNSGKFSGNWVNSLAFYRIKINDLWKWRELDFCLSTGSLAQWPVELDDNRRKLYQVCWNLTTASEPSMNIVADKNGTVRKCSPDDSYPI